MWQNNLVHIHRLLISGVHLDERSSRFCCGVEELNQSTLRAKEKRIVFEVVVVGRATWESLS